MISEGGEPVDAGWVGPEVGAKPGVRAAVGEKIADSLVAPVRDASTSESHALLDRASGVDEVMQLGADQHMEVVEPHAGEQLLVVVGHEQGERLRKTLQQDLMRGVDGEHAQPGDVDVRAPGGVGRALECVAEDLMECELPRSNGGELRSPKVQAQAGGRSLPVEPVGPVLIDLDRLDRHAERSVRSAELSDVRLELCCGRLDRPTRVVGLQPALDRLQRRLGLLVPGDAELLQVLDRALVHVVQVTVRPAGRTASLRPSDVLGEVDPLSEKCA